jgi:release factor glutamine methyltransferase
VRVVEGSWFDPLPPELAGRLDLVVSNPPYVRADDPLPAAVADWEPGEALVAGVDGLDDVRDLLESAGRWLAPGGGIVIEIDPRQADETIALATSSGLVDAEVGEDLSRRSRWLRARRRA